MVDADWKKIVNVLIDIRDVPERVSISCRTCGIQHDSNKIKENESCVKFGEQNCI